MLNKSLFQIQPELIYITMGIGLAIEDWILLKFTNYQKTIDNLFHILIIAAGTAPTACCSPAEPWSPSSSPPSASSPPLRK